MCKEHESRLDGNWDRGTTPVTAAVYFGGDRRRSPVTGVVMYLISESNLCRNYCKIRLGINPNFDYRPIRISRYAAFKLLIYIQYATGLGNGKQTRTYGWFQPINVQQIVRLE